MTSAGQYCANMAQAKAHDFRRFAELVTSGSSKVDAYCAVTGKVKNKTAFEQASKWWRNPVTVEHAARLRGVLTVEPEVVLSPVEVVKAQWHRAKFVGYLETGLVTSPLRIAAKIASVATLEEACGLLTDEEHAALEGMEVSVRCDDAGKQIMTFKVKLTSKAAKAAILKNVQGFGPEKEGAEDLGALVRRLIKPTPGLHGEHVNHAALEAQEAMAQKNPA